MTTMPSAHNDTPFVEGFDFTPATLIRGLQMEHFCHAFLPNLMAASEVTQAVLLNGPEPLDTTRLYRHALFTLMRRGDFELPIASCSLTANVAWQLRKAAVLSDEQIADVLCTTTAEVHHRIADVLATLAMDPDAA